MRVDLVAIDLVRIDLVKGSHTHTLASFPGPALLSVAVRKSGRGPGIFYHVSDIEGREKVERT